MNDYKDKSCCVVDNGLFCELAIKLSESFKTVYYWSPWQSAFPKSNQMLIGKGIPEIRRVDNLFDVVDDTDLFVFPDVYCGDIQLHLENIGKRVWGSRRGEELELYRDASKKHMRSLGIPIGNYTVITGIPDLRSYLKEHDNQWVKINITRGDTETFHSENYKLIEPRLDDLENKLGAKKHIMEFIVEEAIDDAVEAGTDMYCIDGVFPSKGICGIEIKDKGYIAIVRDYKSMPEQLTSFNDKIAGTLKKYRYRNFISSELRITRDGTAYAIDPCTRLGSPPSEIYINLFENLADIIWEGAEGRCIDPVISHKFAVELIIHSQWADQHWQALQFPEELRNNLKFRNLTKIGNEYYVVPQNVGLPEVGAVVAFGDSIDEAIKKATEYSEQVKSFDLEVFPDIFDDAQEEIEKLKAWGIDLIGDENDSTDSDSIGIREREFA